MEDMLKQAKLKALRLLSDMDRTEEQLRMKLKQKGYSEDVVEQAVQYVKSFGYINDAEYAKRFVQSRQAVKSRYEIYMELCQRGVDREFVEQAMEVCYESYSEEETIRNLMAKKHVSLEDCSEAEKMKIYGYFRRKGFKNEDIRQVLQVSERNA